MILGTRAHSAKADELEKIIKRRALVRELSERNPVAMNAVLRKLGLGDTIGGLGDSSFANDDIAKQWLEEQKAEIIEKLKQDENFEDILKLRDNPEKLKRRLDELGYRNGKIGFMITICLADHERYV